jgi:TetR/AcrR family transcriptional repressor of nem operon
MKGAGLTVGGFYGHFDSKETLFAAALRHAAGAMRRRLLDGPAAATARERVLDVARRYLSRRHRDDVDQGCPLPAAVAEVIREGQPYRDVLMGELGALIDALAGVLGETPRARGQALAIMSLLYGALSLARAAGPSKLSDELLAAARTFIADALPEGDAAAGRGRGRPTAPARR